MNTRKDYRTRSAFFNLARLALTLAAILALIYPLGSAMALSPDVIQVFVDDDFDGETTGWGVDHFATIAAGVAAVDSGGFVDVAPGIYVETVEITKPLTLRGAQFGEDPRPTGAGQRPGGESILRPPFVDVTDTNLITVKASNVTIDGFTFDGNNPSLGLCGPADENISFGVCLHIAGGIANGTQADQYATTVSGLTIANNIFKNLNLYGVTISSLPKIAASFHIINQNMFDNLAGGDTPFGSRRAIRVARNQYVTITNNKATRVRIGIEMTVYDRFSPAASASIINNDLQTSRDGIWLNSFLGDSSPVLIDSNTLRTVPGSPVENNGITITTVKDGAQIQLSNNTVTSGAEEGIYIFNLGTMIPVRILDLTVNSPSMVGVSLNNVRSENEATGPARVVLENASITGGKYGISILDKGSTITSTLTLTMTNNSAISGSLTGIQVKGPKATLNLLDNGGSSGVSGNGVGLEVSSGARVNAVGNRMDENTAGVLITGTLGSSVVIFNNDISDSGTIGVWNNTTSTVDMAGNYWGSAAPDTVASEMSGSVDFSPWLNTGNDVDASPGFQGDFSLLTVDDLASELSLNALQEGITMAVAPGIVNVAPGTYPTGVTIDKEIDLRMSGNVTVTGDIHQLQGTLTGSSSNLTLMGDLLRSGGTFTANNGSVSLLGTSLQQVGGSAATTFQHLIMGNPAGAELLGDSQVNGILTLNQGLLNLNAHDLTLGASSAVAGAAPGNGNMIVTQGGGAVCKVFTAPGGFTFPIGDATGTASYSPATVEFTAGNFSPSGTACVEVIDARYPANFASNHLTRYWSLSSAGISSYSADLTFNYASDIEDVVGLETALLELGFTGSTLAYQGDPVVSSSNSMQITTSNMNGVVYTAGNAAPSVVLSSFEVIRLSPTSAQIDWTVAAESGINGYHLWRSTSIDGEKEPVNSDDPDNPVLIPPEGPGSSYQVIDSGIQTGTRYYYWLEVDSTNNNDYMIGPTILEWYNLYMPITLR